MSLVMSQQTHAQEVTSHFPVARLVTIGHFQSEQSLVVVAQWEEHALSVSTYKGNFIKDYKVNVVSFHADSWTISSRCNILPLRLRHTEGIITAPATMYRTPER